MEVPMTQAQAEITANDIIGPYLEQLSMDAIDGLIVRIASNLQNTSYTHFQHGLDTVPMGGSHSKHSKKITVQ